MLKSMLNRAGISDADAAAPRLNSEYEPMMTNKIMEVLRSKTVISGLAFQVLWVVCIFTQNVPIAFGLLAYLLFHFLTISREKSDWLYSLKILVIGLALDSYWIYSGVISNASGSLVVPFWLFSLWAGFALALPHAFSFLRGRYVLASIFGAIGGAMSYFSGAKLRGDVSLAEPSLVSLAYISIAWAILMPVAFFLLEMHHQRSDAAAKEISGEGNE